MQTPYFSPEHDLFRRSVRDFFEQEVRPHAAEWEREQRIPREIWKKMGELGFLGINFPEKYGGAGADFFIRWPFWRKWAGSGWAVLPRLSLSRNTWLRRICSAPAVRS